jgi:RNA-splicing ligase RtcB
LPELPQSLADMPLGAPALEQLRRREGRAELGTLGRGNHFVELQAAEHGRLRLMLESRSRAMGQAIRDHHLQAASVRVGDFAATAAHLRQQPRFLANRPRHEPEPRQ